MPDLTKSMMEVGARAFARSGGNPSAVLAAWGLAYPDRDFGQEELLDERFLAECQKAVLSQAPEGVASKLEVLQRLTSAMRVMPDLAAKLLSANGPVDWTDIVNNPELLAGVESVKIANDGAVTVTMPKLTALAKSISDLQGYNAPRKTTVHVDTSKMVSALPALKPSTELVAYTDGDEIEDVIEGSPEDPAVTTVKPEKAIPAYKIKALEHVEEARCEQEPGGSGGELEEGGQPDQGGGSGGWDAIWKDLGDLGVPGDEGGGPGGASNIQRTAGRDGGEEDPGEGLQEADGDEGNLGV